MIPEVKPNVYTMSARLSKLNYHAICDHLAAGDPDLLAVIDAYGYPPLWTRPNTFETLVHIILEQQVSLASALAALVKLREYVGVIEPEKVLLLSEEEFKACYFSRQKTAYTRSLADALVSGQFSLTALEDLSDDEVRSRLVSLKVSVTGPPIYILCSFCSVRLSFRPAIWLPLTHLKR